VRGTLPTIERVKVRMADTRQIRSQLAEGVRRYPYSREAADHSFYFLIAVALADGELTTRQFHGERWQDPDIRELMGRINISTDAILNTRAPGGFPCALEITLQSGESRSAEVAYAPGHPQGGNVSEVVQAKFLTCARERLAATAASMVVDDVMKLETLPSLAVIMRNLSAIKH
jgi:2-methylcitrate dehydratase